ncbi:hypothetical protein BSKO_02717 [Bryopsis sp. KO-2023]|nr:hypothetical protein BSKO_02717 [Bryopsis sp. KO-2023]
MITIASDQSCSGWPACATCDSGTSGEPGWRSRQPDLGTAGVPAPVTSTDQASPSVPGSRISVEARQVLALVLVRSTILYSLIHSPCGRPWWSRRVSRPNAQGQKVMDFLVDHDLQVLNDKDSLATYVHHNGEEFDLDITVTNSAHLVTSWQVFDIADRLTDHNLIRFAVRCGGVLEDHETRLNWRNTDWDNLIPGIERTISDNHWDVFGWDLVHSAGELSCRIDDFQACLLEEAKRHVPVFRVRGSNRPWWTPEVKEAHQAHVRAQRRVTRYRRRHGFPVNVDLQAAARTARTTFKATLEEAKQVLWRETSAELTSETCWRYMKNIQNKHCRVHTSFVRVDDEVISDAEQISEQLGRKFFPTSPVDMGVEHQPFETQVNHWRSSRVPQPGPLITGVEVLSRIKKVRPFSAPGPDGVSPSLLKKCWVLLLPILVDIFNSCIRLETFPVVWKQATVVPVPKSPTHNQAVSCLRPISLLSVLGKIFESILQSRIQEFLESTGKLSEHQYGFRRHRSCTDALRVMLGKLHQAKRDGHPFTGGQFYGSRINPLFIRS